MTSGHFFITLLFISFHHFQPNLDTPSPHPSSHDEWISPRTLLFISFHHFQPNLDTPSPHPSSHDKWTSSYDTPLHLFPSLSTKPWHSITSSIITWQVDILHYTPLHLFPSLSTKPWHSITSSIITWQVDILLLDSSSSLSITFNQTLTLHHLIHHHMTSEWKEVFVYRKGDVCWFWTIIVVAGGFVGHIGWVNRVFGSGWVDVGKEIILRCQ